MDAGRQAGSRGSWRTRALARGFAQLLLGLTTAAAQFRLSDQTLEVKFQSNHIVSLESSPKGGHLVVRTRDGQLERTVEAGSGLKDMRRVEVHDFALTGDGTLLVSMAALYPLGASSRVLALYPLQGEPGFLTLDAVLCFRLASDPATGIWCLGPGLEESLFHRLSGPASGPWGILPRKRVRLIGSDADEPRQAHETGPAGSPAMLAEAAGHMAAWVPNAAAVLEFDTKTSEVVTWPVPLAQQGKSQMSFAAAPDGAIYGLMPQRGRNELEQLDTPYRLMRLKRDSGTWVVVPGTPVVPRGAVLAGVDGPRAVIWKRPTRTVEWVQIR
ncbi:hypothetical protein [Paludibaculum fermentans]|uniref:Uncharacterized protein n=1 Tax=Paludibaculum fermentans TaxID=1473598 RepID=A0A7S7SMG8_PALFE|nr:hypothetical protein [Paludibaculum fermentans]QOY89466.1 hypothetical protein IRI77_05810 [Paludibaculum fermentans]